MLSKDDVIDFIFKYATYGLLCVMICFAIGYVLAGSHVVDFIVNWSNNNAK